MAVDERLVDWVREALEPLGTVTMRKMIGNAALYCDGTIFAVADGSALWFKADAESDATWDAEGCERVTFEDRGKIVTVNYRRAPDDVYDDPEAMRRWAGLALEAGRRAPVRKPKKPKPAS